MAVKNYLDNLDKSVQGEDVAEKQTRWASFQKYVLNDVITGKYKALLKMRFMFRNGKQKWSTTIKKPNIHFNI